MRDGRGGPGGWGSGWGGGIIPISMHLLDNVRIYFGDDDDGEIYWDGTNLQINTTSGGVYVQDDVYVTTHLHFGDTDTLLMGTGDDSIQQFTGTAYAWTFAALAAADVNGANWTLTTQDGGTGGTGNHTGGSIELATGAGQGTSAGGSITLDSAA